MAQRYDIYKDSGVQWLGEIPGHWGCVRVKNILKESQQITEDGKEEQLSVTQAFGIIRSADAKISNPPSSTLGWKIVKKNDIVFNKYKAHSGVFFASQYDGIVTFNYSVYNCYDNCHPKYYELLFHTNLCIGEFRKLMRGVGESISPLYTVQLYTIHIPLPPLSEQHAIVSYLDAKCGKIDEWVAQKQKEVELLLEMKQRVIADAVTRGLDSNVKMKATNIPWLPEVPEHWDCVKMKYLFNERSEKNHPDEVSLCATQTYGVIPQKLYCSYGNRVVEVSKGFELLKFVKEGDFVIHLRSFQGGIEYAYYQGIISPAYTILEPKDLNNSPYFKFLFKSYNFIQLLKTCVTGIREGQNINYSMLGNKYLFIPPLEEQKQIVAYITSKTSKIDKLIANINKEISAIKEYKQRLISDVVTGQIKVC